ncbi:DUF2283 domain-containing protein [Candidatus Pacearchaeota archaeon]|nr:DUF2283 domain-containing protein [Candidatus Pacearchaeota archaeon]
MAGKMEMHYDEEADYLEIFVGEPRADYGEHISKDIVIFKYEDNGKLYGIGIFNFKKRASSLKDVLSNLPISIKIESA